jgi:hypothetical protein
VRTVSFQSVYEGVLSRHGLDPLAYTADHDTARAIANNITRRARKGWKTWDYPEFTRTEERAFRASWSATRQYKRMGSDLHRPDELYWPVAPYAGYYRVLTTANIDPPIGTPPTANSPAYFELFTPEPYIERDQLDRNPIGEVLGVYSSDPSFETDCAISIALPFRPSERGIRILGEGVSNATVFVWYQVPPPQFSKKPWAAGKSYLPGDIVFYNGDCYSCIVANSADAPPNSSSWMLEPVPDTLAEYLVAGAYAD